MSFSKNHLKKKDNIYRVFKNGRAVVGGFIFLKILKNDIENNRFAFIVGLKVSKSAVLRNKIKRQFNEIARGNYSLMKTGFDFLVVAKPEIIGKQYSEIKKELLSLFIRSKIMNK